MEELRMNIESLKIKNSETVITLEATVPTGLESVAFKEILQKLIIAHDDISVIPGRIYFNITFDLFPKVMKLRSIDNVNLVVDFIPELNFQGDKEACLIEIVSLVNKIDLKTAVKQWSSIIHYPGNILPDRSQHDAARITQDQKRNENDNKNDCKYLHNVLKYRVTCNRIGKHLFTSNEAAYRFGGEINNQLNWIVALSDWDLNVLLRIQEHSALICFKVTVQSLHRRCLTHFGPTSLRPTIAYGMLSLADLRPGDLVVDPLCGGGSIPIECAHAFPDVIVSCGDIHEKAVERTWNNVQGQLLSIVNVPDIFMWNAIRLPFKDHQVDAIVTDIPFGKRSGNKYNNATFYKCLMKEFARVLCLESGRLVVLTHDTPHLFKALDYRDPKSCWHINRILAVNVGALKCNLIVARRKKRNN